MVRPLNDSPYLYGLHDPGGEYIMADQGVPGWVLFTEELGSDPNNTSGRDYSQWANQNFGILVRLNNGYEPNGTIPHSSRYGDFARRCANFVRASAGCHIWIIGNEMNYAVERPDVQIDWGQNPPQVRQPGEAITPDLYIACYRQCRSAIKSVPGHQNDLVIVGAPAPWNEQTKYGGNSTGDWAKYLTDILTPLGPNGCDGISIHAYTHGAEPALVYTDAAMNAPFQNRQYNFRTYRDFMQAIPANMRGLPVYLTETDQNDEWRNENRGWVQRAYGEIDAWNRTAGNQKIRAVILYRWPRGLDKWGIEGKAGVIEDFKQAMAHKYNWEAAPQPQPQPVQPVQPVQPQPSQPVQPQPSVDTGPIKFPQTGRTAQGAFAAFYRQFGADVTGFPITDEYINPESGLKSQDWQRVLMEQLPTGGIRLRLAGEELTRLRTRVSQLEAQVARLTSAGGGPAEPVIEDISQQLPRKAEGFVQRSSAEIQFIVINHTGVRPEVGADRVAEAHAKRWPGIAAQYFVTGDGRIQQTNPLDQVVARDQAWIYNGVSIYVAGNFDDAIPSDAQLTAVAELCAWLMAQFSLDETAIRGASEMITTRSPGQQWLGGHNWKAALLDRVRAVPAVPSDTTTGNQAALRAQIAGLQGQIAQLQVQLAEQQQRNAELQARLDAALQNTGGAAKVSRPTITDITLQLPRAASGLKPRAISEIRYLVFNHTAVDASVGVDRIAAAHQKRWGAILYQFFIAADGAILQTNPPDQVVDTSQPWISQGLNIAVAGNFVAEAPTDAQLQAAAQLSAWLLQEYSLGTDSIKGVSEFISTQSPGQQWMQGKKWKDTLLARIAEIQKTTAPGPAYGDSAALAALRTQVSQLQGALAQAQARVDALTQERDRLKAQIGKPSSTEAQLTQQVQTLSTQLQAAAVERAGLAQQVQALGQEKNNLAAQLQAANSDKAALAGQVQSLSTEKNALAGQLASAVQEKNALNQRISELQARIKVLEAGGGGAITPSAPPQVAAPAIDDVVDTLARHATLTYAARPLSKITHLTIHHSAAPANITPQQVATYHVNTAGWPGIGYHFYVEPSGIIYQVNRLETVAYHVGDSNPYSVGICVSGTFSGGITPTPRQIERTAHLVAWLMQKLNLKLENVMGHKEFPENVTQCPGDDWLAGKRWKNLLFARVKDVLEGRAAPGAKTIGHYMLFWQRQDDWAKEDFAAATSYFARFRPTVGFSADDASNAEYVTIVGGPAGVSTETEQALEASGCKVERLAGADFADTKRMLDELARTGKRFRTFNV